MTLFTPATPVASHSFALVAGAGDTDNGKFSIENTNQLRSSQTRPVGTYNIRVQGNDGDVPPTVLEKAFSILSSAGTYGTFVAEAEVAAGTPTGGELVATLEALDGDGSSIGTFGIVGGRDDLFQISGNQLQQKAVADPGALGSIHYVTLFADGVIDTFVSVKIAVVAAPSDTVVRLN